MRLFEDLVVQEVSLRSDVKRLLQIMVNGVPPVDGPGILLTRDQYVSIPLEAAGLAPRRLPEVRTGDVAHLE